MQIECYTEKPPSLNFHSFFGGTVISWFSNMVSFALDCYRLKIVCLARVVCIVEQMMRVNLCCGWLSAFSSSPDFVIIKDHHEPRLTSSSALRDAHGADSKGLPQGSYV
jgi:hypothetical protein